MTYFIFPCACIQSRSVVSTAQEAPGFLASMQLAQSWSKQLVLPTVETAFEDSFGLCGALKGWF